MIEPIGFKLEETIVKQLKLITVVGMSISLFWGCHKEEKEEKAESISQPFSSGDLTVERDELERLRREAEAERQKNDAERQKLQQERQELEAEKDRSSESEDSADSANAGQEVGLKLNFKMNLLHALYAPEVMAQLKGYNLRVEPVLPCSGVTKSMDAGKLPADSLLAIRVSNHCDYRIKLSMGGFQDGAFGQALLVSSQDHLTQGLVISKDRLGQADQSFDMTWYSTDAGHAAGFVASEGIKKEFNDDVAKNVLIQCAECHRQYQTLHHIDSLEEMLRPGHAEAMVASLSTSGAGVMPPQDLAKDLSALLDTTIGESTMRDRLRQWIEANRKFNDEADQSSCAGQWGPYTVAPHLRACFYYAEPKQSCNQACALHGGVNMEATIWANSSHSCEAVLDLVEAPLSGSILGLQYEAPSSLATETGCGVFERGEAPGRFFVEGVEPSSDGYNEESEGFRRACSCRQ